MNTEQIMELVEQLRLSRECGMGNTEDAYKSLQSAVEALVQKCNSLKEINSDLVDKCNAQNLDGARLDDQIRGLVQERDAATTAALERAAVVCDQFEYEYWRTQEDQEFTPVDCAVAIRSLKDKP